MSFCPLHCHTTYSALDGFGLPQNWVDRAKEAGVETLAITEHGNIDSVIAMSNLCKQNGIKYISAVEAYICKDLREKNPARENCHICLYAKNMVGWKNILNMLTIANVEGFHYKPRIDGETLLKHLNGICVSTACLGSFLRYEWGLKLFDQLDEKIHDDLFLEIMPHDIQGQAEWNQKILDLAGRYGNTVIATNDSHYPRREDAVYQEVCLAISSGSTWNDPKRMRFDNDHFFLASEDEMLEFFKKHHKYIPETKAKRYLRNTQKLADRCEMLVFEKKEADLPVAPSVPLERLQQNGKNEDDYLSTLIRRGLKEKERNGQLCRPIEDYQKRIDEELELIKSKGFSRYFLIVIDLISWCSNNGVLTGPGRGSVGGSLVAWLTGITQVDPLKYDLLFSRFLDPSRSDAPDVDQDIEKDRRDEAIEYLRNAYGRENVVQITTLMTLKGASALQDVARVFCIPRLEMNEITALLEDEEDITVETFSQSENPLLLDFYQKHEKIVRLAIGIKNNIRGYGKHAAGVCISNHNLMNGDNGNLCKRNGILTSNWAKEEAEYMGLLKLDCLGLTALSRIRVCCEMIEKNHNTKIDLPSIDVNDKNALKLINDGDCVGVFQLGTKGITRLCQDIGVTSFKDVYNATALYRPGPLSSGMVKDFIDRRRGKEFGYSSKQMKEITEETSGIFVYQEQIMAACNKLAGMDWGTCNKIRKLIAKSKGEEALNIYKDAFVKGCGENVNMPFEAATSLWEDFVKFGKYCFNKSHSVEYSVISLWDAWLKYYYPGEFYASCLSYLDEDKRLEMLEEASARGIRVVLPKNDLSDAKNWIYSKEKNLLVMPFVEIASVGEIAAKSIVEATKKKKKTFFGKKANLDSVPASIRQSLAKIHSDDIEWVPKYNEVKNIKDLFKYNLYRILDL